MLTLCLQTWNLLVVVPCFTLLKIMKQWSRWSSKAGFQRWDTCPEPTELPWIGCSTRFNFIPRYTSNMLTPNTNLLTCSPKETSHVTSGITLFACSMVAISVQQAACKRCRKEHRKKREKKESWQSRGWRWAWKFECIEPPGDTQSIQSKFESYLKHIIPTLQENVLSPSDFAEYIYHVGSSHDLRSIIQSGLIAGGKDVKRGRQTVFFTAVNPMFVHLHKQREYDVTKPGVANYMQNWKVHQNGVYWDNLRVAQKKELTFCQTGSNAIILQHTPSILHWKSGGNEFGRRFEK